MNWELCLEMAPGIEVREGVDGYVVYDAVADRLHFLSATAVFVLQCCDGRVRAAELPAILAEVFGLEQEPWADVESCLNALMAENLLRPATPVVQGV